jgi:hypothetical protein
MTAKRWAFLFACALAAGLIAFGITRWSCRAPDLNGEDEVAWLRDEFRLTPAQTAAIEKLHDDYHPVCMEHCRRITQARARLALATDKTSAQAELARLEAVCHDATQAHLRRVAAVMPPEQAERFLSLVLPKVSGQTHDAPLGLK